MFTTPKRLKIDRFQGLRGLLIGIPTVSGKAVALLLRRLIAILNVIESQQTRLNEVIGRSIFSQVESCDSNHPRSVVLSAEACIPRLNFLESLPSFSRALNKIQELQQLRKSLNRVPAANC